jgi:eukaryotic-like serine/threonine-protein kinase
MGVVWQARDALLSRDVAVKELIWPAYFSEAEQQAACRRATREAKMAARLNHRNVIRVFDIFEEDGCPWIVMEFLPHGSLSDLVKEEGPLSPARATGVGLAILAALRAAHAAGIVHRDVKPANILMGPGRVVLADFGIAQADGTSAITTVGALIGSPSYIAPERARGGRSGPAGDLWGLGASLYAAVEGHGPFDRDGGALASLTAVVADEPEPSIRAGPLLWPVISGLLRKDPDRRLDAAEAERMLRLAAAAPVSAVTPRSRPPRGRASVLAGLVALVLMAAAGTAAGLVFTGSPGHERAAAAGIASPAAASTRAPAASTHPPAPGSRPRTPVETHVTARTSPSSSRSARATRSSRTGNSGDGNAGWGRLAVRVNRARHAPYWPGPAWRLPRWGMGGQAGW